MLQAGIYVPAVSRKKRIKNDIRIELAEAVSKKDYSHKDGVHIRMLVENIFKEHSAHTIVISNEGLLGKPFVGARGKFYADCRQRAVRLAEILDGLDVEVSFFIRDYASFFPSWYVQQVRMGSLLSFEEFCKAHDPDKASWNEAAKALIDQFGRNETRIFDHADLVGDTHRILMEAFPRVMAALGPNGRQIRRKNTSIGEGMVNIYRRWNKIAQKLGWSAKTRNAIRHFGRRYGLLPWERFSNSAKISFEPEQATRLSARYQLDLASIREMAAQHS